MPRGFRILSRPRAVSPAQFAAPPVADASDVMARMTATDRLHEGFAL